MADERPLLRAYLAVSLDGYIADVRGGVDWLEPYTVPEIDFAGFMETIGRTVMGRATYDQALAKGHLEGLGEGLVVMTRRPLPNPPPGVEAWPRPGEIGDVLGLAEQLRWELAGTGQDVWLMGGGRSLAPLHQAGLVDRWELAIIPVLLGQGIPLFPRRTVAPEGLRLVSSRALSNGILETRYEAHRD